MAPNAHLVFEIICALGRKSHAAVFEKSNAQVATAMQLRRGLLRVLADVTYSINPVL
jgi:hypothetical protein